MRDYGEATAGIAKPPSKGSLLASTASVSLRQRQAQSARHPLKRCAGTGLPPTRGTPMHINLGAAYSAGDGVLPDYVQADTWTNLAASISKRRRSEENSAR